MMIATQPQNHLGLLASTVACFAVSLLMPITSEKYDLLILVAGSVLTVYTLSLSCSYLAAVPTAFCIIYALKRYQ
jgi:hypothetical protein